MDSSTTLSLLFYNRFRKELWGEKKFVMPQKQNDWYSNRDCGGWAVTVPTKDGLFPFAFFEESSLRKLLYDVKDLQSDSFRLGS